MFTIPIIAYFLFSRKRVWLFLIHSGVIFSSFDLSQRQLAGVIASVACIFGLKISFVVSAWKDNKEEFAASSEADLQKKDN